MATPQKTAARPAAPTGKPAARPAAPTQQAAKPTTAAKMPPNVGVAAEKQATRAESAQTTAVAPRPSTAGAGRDAVPDYLNQGQSRGSENVEMQDLVIPRIELVQALSKCLEEGTAEWIEGATAGMFYNSVTRELYGKSVLLCPTFFKKQYLAWRDRKKGGGFGGAFDVASDAHEAISVKTDKEGRNNSDEWEAVETAQQIVLVVSPEDYSTSEAVLSCARTKVKVSRQWNSLIRVNGFDRFSRIYELFSTDEQNPNGDRYKNIAIRYVDFAPVAVYKAAEALYLSIASGAVKVKIDETYIDGGTGDESAPGAQPGDPGSAGSEY